MTVMHQQWLKHKWTICCINSQIPKCLTTTNISNLITKLKMSVFCSASELLFLGNNSVCWMYFFFYIKKNIFLNTQYDQMQFQWWDLENQMIKVLILRGIKQNILLKKTKQRTLFKISIASNYRLPFLICCNEISD